MFNSQYKVCKPCEIGGVFGVAVVGTKGKKRVLARTTKPDTLD